MPKPRYLAILLLGAVAAGGGAAEPTVDFNTEIEPILTRSCVGCHGPAKQKGNLRLDTRAAATKDGALVPGRTDASLLVKRIASADAEMRMPPETEKPLSGIEIARLKLWIDQGAKWPEKAGPIAAPLDWWSLKPLHKSALPASPSVNPIDAFVRAKLVEKRLKPSEPASKRTLIRRLHFDLIGLPPTPEQIAAFENDPAPAAYAKLVDSLLASERYGERWARHWLDVVHFGETHGYDKDQPRPNAWPYRDYVIRSFNEDKPYAKFVREQVAGDVLFPGTRDGIEALGFIAAGPWDLIGHAEVPESKIDGKVARHLDRDDMVQNTMQTFVSLTVGCAQCHDHKFDPIRQEEYYGLQAVFAALDRADRRYDVDPAVAVKRAALNAKNQKLARIAGFDAKIVPDTLTVGRELAALPPQSVAYTGTVHTGSGAFAGTGADGGRPRAIHLLNRGSVTKPGAVVPPGGLSAVSGLSPKFDLPAGHSEGERRKALALWLSDSKNPLVWRSIVNRVWHYHFGRGLVETGNDFGRNGSLPTHPELLDWLAADFRDGGQSIKNLHRRIVLSETYRQACAGDAKAEKTDAGNQYLWRMNRRKLEAEAVRDSVLQLAGKLDLTMYGPSFRDFVIEKPEHSPHYQYHLHDPEDPKSHRRSVYRFAVRSQTQPFLTALDCADPSLQVDRRNQSQSPAQALALLNNDFMAVMAKHFAKRLEALPGEAKDRVRRGFLETTGREATESEMTALAAHAKKHGLASLCRLLFNLNEAAFVD